MKVSEDVARKLLNVVQNIRARTTPEILLQGDTRGQKRARILEAISQTVLPRQLEFTSVLNGLEKAKIILQVGSARVTGVLAISPDDLGDAPGISGVDRIQAAQQLGHLIMAFSRMDGDVFLSSIPPENPSDADNVGITLSELLAVVSVEDLPEDTVDAIETVDKSDVGEIVEAPAQTLSIDADHIQDIGAEFYDACANFSMNRLEMNTSGDIKRQSGEAEILPDLSALLAMDLGDWRKDSKPAIPTPQLIVMRPAKGRDPALAMYCDETGTVIVTHETRKLGSVVAALNELQKDHVGTE